MNKLFNIQLFADEPAEGAEQKHTETDEKKEPGRDEKPVPKYTDEDVDKLINKKFAEWQKQQEKKVSEAERLSKMTAEEKAAEELKKLRAEIDGYKAEAARTEMSKQARAMLQDKGINVGDKLLSCLIADDADTTKAAVENFIELFNAAKDQAVKDALKGAAPKAGNTPSGMTKEQILAVQNRAERQRLMKENAHLF